MPIPLIKRSVLVGYFLYLSRRGKGITIFFSFFISFTQFFFAGIYFGKSSKCVAVESIVSRYSFFTCHVSHPGTTPMVFLLKNSFEISLNFSGVNIVEIGGIMSPGAKNIYKTQISRAC